MDRGIVYSAFARIFLQLRAADGRINQELHARPGHYNTLRKWRLAKQRRRPATNPRHGWFA